MILKITILFSNFSRTVMDIHIIHTYKYTYTHTHIYIYMYTSILITLLIKFYM